MMQEATEVMAREYNIISMRGFDFTLWADYLRAHALIFDICRTRPCHDWPYITDASH